MSRAFVAVVPPEGVLDEAAALSKRITTLLPDTARRTTRDQWHLTLQFLGNRADLDAVGEALMLLALAPGEVRLGGLGAFPSARRARVCWLGVAEGEPWLAQAVAAIGALLAPLGHEPDARPYHPHLTLARLKAPTDLRQALGSMSAEHVGEAWWVTEVVLFESVTHASGAEHRPHLRVRLGA